MPTITIKQIDNTSAAALRQLKNVFLIGPKGTPDTSVGTEVESDSNKVYYFTSGANFKRTIGKCDSAPEYSFGEYKCKSYGNQMAAELLALGYGVYYYCIEAQTDFTTIVGKTDGWSWEWLTDTSLYPIDYIAPGFVGAACYELITTLRGIVADRSGDCLLLVDIPTESGESGAGYLQSVKDGSVKMGDGTNITITEDSPLLEKLAAETYKLVLDNNCAPFAPVCSISGLSAGYSESVLPASFYYLACAINAEENLGYKEWFAVAGLIRGRRSDCIATPRITFGDRDATICAPRSTDADNNSYKFNYAVNLVAKQAGGFYIWGNRTGKLLDAEGLVAEHFLNIQRLCMSLKKRIYSTCKKLTFDPNSDILWSNFVGGIEPLLKDMQANQGINGYKIIRVKSDVKAMMRAKIRIVPIEAVEDFEIEISLEDLIEA